MKIYLKKFNFDGEPDSGFLSQMASKTENFTSADLRGLCQNAQLAKISHSIEENATSFALSEQDIY